MALNHRLTIVGSDVNNNNAEIRVYLENYAGQPVEREGTDEYFSIEWGADGKQLPLIYGSALTVRFSALNDYEFMDLFTSSSRAVYFELLINDSLFWAGFIEPEKWGEPLISAPYEVSIIAYDGLGLLKDEDFLNPDKTEITGEYTPRQILQIVLAKTGLSLPLNTAVNIRPATFPDTTDPLNHYKINAAIYAGLSCYEVLEQLFLNCRIMQRFGEWFIISNSLLKNAQVTFYQYTAAGAENGTAARNLRLTGFTFEDTPNLEMTGAVKQLTVNQDYGYLGNVVNNANFNEFINGGFTNWTAVNVLPEQRNYDNDGGKFIYIPGGEYTNPWEQATRTKYMVSDAIPIKQSTDTFNIKFKYALMGQNGKSAKMFIGVLIKGATHNHTLEAYLNSSHEIKYRWIAVSQSVTVPWPVPVKSWVKHKNPFPWFTPDEFELRASDIEAHLYNEITDYFEEISINPDGGTPVDGDLHFFLFTPDHNTTGIGGACFEMVNLFITDANATEYKTSTRLTLINNLANNYNPTDIKLINGDAPNVPNADTIYRGGFKLTDGTPTALWTVDGVTSYTYAELAARLTASEIRNIKQTYRARLANVTPGLTMVFEDTDNFNNGRYFVEVAIIFDFVLNTIDGRFVELLDTDLTPFSVINTDTTQPAASSQQPAASSGTPAATLSTDEKVKLIDPSTFISMGQAGYLSAEYFDQETDAVTGRTMVIMAAAWLNQILPKANEHTISAGNTVITFLTPFDTGAEYILHTFTTDPATGYQVGSNILSKTNEGFTIKAAKQCNLIYYAIPKR